MKVGGVYMVTGRARLDSWGHKPGVYEHRLMRLTRIVKGKGAKGQVYKYHFASLNGHHPRGWYKASQCAKMPKKYTLQRSNDFNNVWGYTTARSKIKNFRASKSAVKAYDKKYHAKGTTRRPDLPKEDLTKLHLASGKSLQMGA